MQLFYTSDISGDNYTLNESESKHCIRVLRLQVGSVLHLTDGKGTIFKAEIVNANPKACELIINERLIDYEKRNYKVHIAIAPTKNMDRFEWFLEKATEIGVDEITPLISEHSERKIVKHDRLERVIVAAMKQSIKAYKPVLNPIITYNDFLTQPSLYDKHFIAHCNQGQKQTLKEALEINQSNCILIGPEGDFSSEEVGLAIAKGFIPVSLGNARLRTETAGVVACHTVHLMHQ
jgi:16S rRNA (uracil1498-N3)-methyltransferase